MEKEQVVKKIRFDYLDIAKFIAIFCVILGHTTSNGATPFFRVVLYAFHMPLFFIITGVSIKDAKKYDLKYMYKFLKKKFMTIMVPYIIWGLIYSMFTYKNFLWVLYGSWFGLVNSNNALSSLWFLPCLFLSRLLVEVVLMIGSFIPKINKRLFAFLVSIPLFVLVFFIPCIENGYPLCADVSLMATAFILVGYAASPLLSKLKESKLWIKLICLVVSLGVFILGLVTLKDKTEIFLMCKGSEYFGNPFNVYVNSFGGSMFILSIGLIIEHLFKNHQNNLVYRSMLCIGQNTIGIYLIHKPFLWQVAKPMLGYAADATPNLGMALILSLITFIYSIIMVFLINRYVPQLIGRFKK